MRYLLHFGDLSNISLNFNAHKFEFQANIPKVNMLISSSGTASTADEERDSAFSVEEEDRSVEGFLGVVVVQKSRKNSAFEASRCG